MLNHRYEELSQNPAWLHYMGLLEDLRESAIAGLKSGLTDKQGNDLTPFLRLLLPMLDTLQTYPEYIKERQRRLEMEEGLAVSGPEDEPRANDMANAMATQPPDPMPPTDRLTNEQLLRLF